MDTKQKSPVAPTRRKPVQPQKKSPPPKGKAKTAKPPVRQGKKPVRRTRPTQEVVYTQPGPFNRNRFLLHLVTVVAVVLALVFGMSIFFKVENVNVSGAEKYTPWEIRQASGIQEGESLLGLSRAKLSSLIRANLPYVEKVRIGIQLPDTVNIEVKELDVVYAVEDSDSSWWLLRSDGIVVEKTDAASADSYTKLLGVQIASPQVGQQATAWHEPPETTEETTGEEEAQDPENPQDQEDQQQTVPPVVDNSAEQLETALMIVQYLEENGMIGVASKVDVTELLNLEFWYGERYRVQLGDNTRLAYKISSVKSAVDQMGKYQDGILDASFTVEIEGRKDQVIYTPFS